jgi:hypothetical protein
VAGSRRENDLNIDIDQEVILMRTIGLTALVLLLWSQAAAALPSWSVISFTATPQNAPKVLAAADKLMNSPVGKEFPGRLLLQAHIADGADPATHSFVPIYTTSAQREQFGQKMQAAPAWAEFLATMTQSTEPVSQVLYRTLKSWGDVADTDPVWMSFSFAVRDPVAFVAAIDKFMASETGKKFPGQAHLSGIVAGGLTSVSHVVSVGYASEAEMETWSDSLIGNADWSAYLEKSRGVADYLGSDLVRDLKAWGPASLTDLTAP